MTPKKSDFKSVGLTMKLSQTDCESLLNMPATLLAVHCIENPLEYMHSLKNQYKPETLHSLMVCNWQSCIYKIRRTHKCNEVQGGFLSHMCLKGRMLPLPKRESAFFRNIEKTIFPGISTGI